MTDAIQEIEQAFLGALIAKDDAFKKAPKLDPAHFIRRVHGEIYSSIRRRYEGGEATTAALLAQEFLNHPDLKEDGGRQYIFGLADNVVSVIATPDYAREIYKAHCKRAVEHHAILCDGSPESMEAAGKLLLELADAGRAKAGGELKVIDPTLWHNLPIPPREWLVEGWIPMRCVTLLYGDGGAGKSLLMMLLLAAAALGGKWLGLNVQQMSAFGFFCEDDSEELQRRQTHINEQLGCDFAALIHLKLYSGVGEDNIFIDFDGQTARGKVSELYKKIEKFVLSSGARLVVFDTAADIFGGNEIVKSEVRAFLNLLAGLALKIDGAIIVCAHPSVAGMASGAGDGGNKAWNNTVRSRLYFRRIEGDETGDLRILTRKKSNYAKVDEVIRVRYTDGVFVQHEESPLLDGIKAQKLRTHILAEIEKRQDTTMPLSSAPNAAMYLPKILCKPPGFKHKDLKEELVRMLADGIITIYQRTARSPKGLRKCV